MATTDAYNKAKEAVASAERELQNLEGEISTRQQQTLQLERDLAVSKNRPDLADLIPSQTASLERARARIADLESKSIATQEKIAIAKSELETATTNVKEDPQTTVKTPEASNQSETDQATSKKYADTTRVPDPSVQQFDDGSSLQTFDDGSTLAIDSEGKVTSTDVSTEEYSKENRSGVPVGAERTRNITKASAEWAESKDLRVLLRVPKSYLKGPAAGPGSILNDFGGILFPYTPTISYDNQAVYGTVNPVHSNYTQYFYKNSQVGQISISGKFTVKNEKEGKIYLAIIHLLRSLTKMRWGSDANAGSPPPVCRLEAYGDYMLRNVPVVIASFKFDLPDSVDYISVKGDYKNSLVPTISTISLSLNSMYSRREMQDYSVDKWIQGNLRGQGYL